MREFVEEALKTPGTLEDMDENAIKFALKAVAKEGDSRTAFSIVDALPESRRTAPLYHGAITACGKARPMKGRAWAASLKESDWHSLDARRGGIIARRGSFRPGAPRGRPLVEEVTAGTAMVLWRRMKAEGVDVPRST